MTLKHSVNYLVATSNNVVEVMTFKQFFQSGKFPLQEEMPSFVKIQPLRRGL